MEELIKITESGKGNPVVNARDLHVFLEVGKDFSTWLKSKLKKYDFVENVDFARLFYDIDGHKIGLPKNGEWTDSEFQKVHKIEYALTLNCAKELAMVQNNERGRQARQYFIEVEKRYKILKEQKEQKQLKPVVVTYTMSEVAERLNLTDYYGKIGRNALYNILFHHKIVNEENRPIRKYIKKGYFVCKPTLKVTENGLNWLNQKFCVEKTSDADLKELFEKQETRLQGLEKKNLLILEGVATVVETLYFNKGGKKTEEQNRQAIHHLQNFLDEAKKELPKMLKE